MQTRIRDHLHKLAVEIGMRPNGSPGNHAAADYIRSVFQACGLTIEEQPFACPDWQLHQSLLTLEDEPLLVAANAFSPACDVGATTVAVSTLAELEAVELDGRIALLHGDLTIAPLSPKSWFLKSERDARIIQLLEQKRPVAILTVQTRPGTLESLIEDWEFAIPSATVPAKVGLTLLHKARATVHLYIDSESAPGSTANLVARLPGTRTEQIVFCAHYDTKFDTPGASDNATGVAVLLTLAQQLSQKPHDYSLEFVAFTGEEYLPTGDEEYVRLRADTFDQIMTAVNFDGVGQALGVNSITSFTCSPAFQQSLVQLTVGQAKLVWVDPWPESNHSTFAWRAVPSIAFSSRGGVNHAHLHNDTVEWVSLERLQELVDVTNEIVKTIEREPPKWTKQY